MPAAPRNNSRPTSPLPPAAAAKAPPRKGRARKGRKTAASRRLELWRRRGHQLLRVLKAAPPAVRTLAVALVVLVTFAFANLIYQVIRKPTEMFFPVSGSLNKLPAETWRQYGPLFRKYSTTTISPELLAALAQVESTGNPVARTYWRWSLTWRPFAIYRPASSAVGMYQMTDPAFADARRYCVRHHAVVEAGDWDDWDSCWFNGLYTRVLPSHAIELTSVSLDRQVAAILSHRAGRATPQQAQDLATIIHLCGAGPGRAFAHRGFRLVAGEACGDHGAAVYLSRVNEMKRLFRRLAAEER